ncbi:AAA family ATPase [Obesumbacterium proteus]|uniref:AAA family ATPase n=1 Tax=Obesumbacterium proteus TaxID=82983 RepID=UPI001F18D38E|nr:ATP-binding protein [Obesumbacterium proteus]MCE9884392.1 AAA family ATPase [Obesumbacterium proteus]MCE9915960.1 AAA family ATPase [Obesumbacterium proteus]MCE9928197.1 AAA family ATPase [Obesumbacterium proteus]MCG2876794.1 AAA family ATPase [Obesumbacterium proteus]
MFLHEVDADFFKGFDRINIPFNTKFTILSGPNGVGKSSVLFAIASAITISFGQLPLNEKTQCRIEFTDRNNNVNSCGFGAGSYKMISRRVSQFMGGPASYVFSNGMNEYIYKNDIAEYISPLFIGPNRNISYQKIDGMKSEKTPSEYRVEYLNSAFDHLAKGYTPEIKQWMINRYFITEKDWAVEERKNWEYIISHLDFIFGSDGRFSFWNIERDLEPSFILDGEQVYLEDLSSGFKSILSIVLSIVEWIEKTNDRNNMDIKTATGVVLIDELDTHLHPSWQTKIREVLLTLFPCVQFIVTSHSPHIISSAQAGEVIVLKREDKSMCYNIIEKSLDAWKTDDIYSMIMGVNTVHQQTLADIVNKIEDLINNSNFDEALYLIDEYSNKIPDSDPTAMILRKQINSVQLKFQQDI